MDKNRERGYQVIAKPLRRQKTLTRALPKVARPLVMADEIFLKTYMDAV